MRIHAFAFLHPRFTWSLLLSLLLLLTFPVAVRAAGENEATAPDCVQAGPASRPVAVQLTRSAELVQATLHSPPGDLPAAGCRALLQFQIPEDHRPRQTVWRDVHGHAVSMDGTPDPAHPDPLPLRLWIQPDGTMQYEVQEAGLEASHVDLNLAVAWGTTAAANDLAVLDILSAALGLELTPQGLGARLNARGRVTELDWHADHPYEYDTIVWFMAPPQDRPKVGIHPPRVRVTWQLPSELGQLTALSRLALGGPLLTGAIPPELGQLTNLEQLTLVGSRLTGTVPPRLGQLTKLTSLELHSNRLTALPSELGQMTQLTYLGVAGNQLTSLPPELGRLTRLRDLGLAGNRLTSLPPELGRLTQLRKLGLAGNRLTTLPPELGQLPNLWALDVQDNQLASLPSLAEFRRLIYLDMSGNRLQELNLVESLTPPFTLPPGAGPLLRQLQQMAKARGALPTPPLESLDLSGNRLTTLPPEIGRLRLVHLDLSYNRLTSLPPALGQIQPKSNLVLFPGPSFVKEPLTLDLSGNQLTDLPSHLARISHLIRLDLSDNQLTALPPELGRLPLNLLDLSDNQLTVLPPDLGRIQPSDQLVSWFGGQPQLTLNLSGNRLTGLPPELDQISDRLRLDLGRNRFTSLPDVLFRLDRLEMLNLSGNRLETLPPELGQLSQLVSLDLSGNQLTHLPPELAQAANLSHLNLSGNQLTGLPAGLGQLSQLDTLDLSNNRLTGLSDPAIDSEQAALWPRRLIRLDLSDNRLTAVPPALTQLRLEILNLGRNQLTDLHLDQAQLKNLKQLDLSHSQLTDLPLDLAQLKNLTHLDLSHNRFTEIPAVLSRLRPLLSLDLRGNPLTTCPLLLPWRIDRFIFPPDYELFGNFDHWLLSPPAKTEYTDLPFLDLCPE